MRHWYPLSSPLAAQGGPVGCGTVGMDSASQSCAILALMQPYSAKQCDYRALRVHVRPMVIHGGPLCASKQAEPAGLQGRLSLFRTVLCVRYLPGWSGWIPKFPISTHLMELTNLIKQTRGLIRPLGRFGNLRKDRHWMHHLSMIRSYRSHTSCTSCTVVWNLE